MKSSYSALIVSGAVLWLLGTPCASSGSAASKTGMQTLPSAAPLQGAASTSGRLRLRGTIQGYDVKTRTLSLETPDGTVKLPLSVSARIGRGPQALVASELGKLSGYRATVRYSESDRGKTVESVHIFGKDERTDR